MKKNDMLRIISKLIIYISFMITIVTNSFFLTHGEKLNAHQYNSKFTSTIPVVDGVGGDSCWDMGDWAPIESLWLGQQPSKSDFSGRYKILWTKERLYFLIEIVDDLISDTHIDPLTDYYKDDTLEIFIDEDGSGGDHRYNPNAFAYHISVKDFNAVDLNKNQAPILLNDHLNIKRTQKDSTYTWEIELKVYSDKYEENSKQNQQIELSKDKLMGFGIAYCDNDGGEDRESFVGSFDIPGNDKNLAWQNASVFSRLKLVSQGKIIQKYYINKPYYYVNYEKKTLDTMPIVKEGRTYLPVRYVTEAIGARVDWDGTYKKTTINFEDKKVELWVGKNSALIDNISVLIDSTSKEAAPFISKGRTYLPLRFVSECLGLKVNWNPALKEIQIHN